MRDFFLDKSRNLFKIVLVLRSASVKRFDVPRMRDFYHSSWGFRSMCNYIKWIVPIVTMLRLQKAQQNFNLMLPRYVQKNVRSQHSCLTIQKNMQDKPQNMHDDPNKTCQTLVRHFFCKYHFQLLTKDKKVNLLF